jgi:hypothetical protein
MWFRCTEVLMYLDLDCNINLFNTVCLILHRFFVNLIHQSLFHTSITAGLCDLKINQIIPI